MRSCSATGGGWWAAVALTVAVTFATAQSPFTGQMLLTQPPTARRAAHASHARTSVTFGRSGWLQFCPAGLRSDGDEPNPNCTSIRPLAFAETDAVGAYAFVSGNGGPRRRLNDLISVTTVGPGRDTTLPLCDAQTPVSTVCGAAADGSGLSYSVLPVTVDLTSIAAGSLHIDAVTFAASGHFRFDGRNYSVAPGTAKFNVLMRNYSFAPNGRAVQVDLAVRVKRQAVDDAAITRDSSDGTITVNRDIICLPRYAVGDGDLTANLTWKAANVTVASSPRGTVTRFAFAGPFSAMAYDPIIQSVDDPFNDWPLDVSDSGSSSSGAVGNGGPTTATVAATTAGGGAAAPAAPHATTAVPPPSAPSRAGGPNSVATPAPGATSPGTTSAAAPSSLSAAFTVRSALAALVPLSAVVLAL